MSRGGLHLLPGAAGRSRLLHLFQTTAMHIVNVAINRNAYRYQWVLADLPDILQHGGPGRGSTARHHPTAQLTSGAWYPTDCACASCAITRRSRVCHHPPPSRRCRGGQGHGGDARAECVHASNRDFIQQTKPDAAVQSYWFTWANNYGTTLPPVRAVWCFEDRRQGHGRDGSGRR